MAVERFPKRINSVVSTARPPASLLPFATGNPEKVRELKALGLQVDPKPSVKPIEIQGDPRTVLEAKARDAYLQNGGPIIVEDTSMDFDAWGQLPGSYAKDFLAERAQREVFAKALPLTNRGATFRVGLAIYDGQEVMVRIGETRGTIAPLPQGPAHFAFDDIFIPNGQSRTYAEMSLGEKNQTSARAKAYRSLVEEPFVIQGQVFEIPEPTPEQMHFVNREALGVNPQTVQFAFGLESLSHVTPNKELHVEESSYLKPIHTKVYADGVVKEYTANPDSASQGVVILPSVDLKTITDAKGNQIALRLDIDANGDPVFGQMGVKRTEMALASRSREFLDMHSDGMHEYIRQLVRGEIPTVKRSNTRSPVLEELIKISVQKDAQGEDVLIPSRDAIAIKELGYKRLSHAGVLSRKEASLKGTILLGPDGVPSSLFALGGMPPVTGSRDVLVTAALSYMRSWIPHNGVFAGNFDRQLALFTQSKDQIQSLGLPKDIEDICIKQIGITFGSEKPEVIAEQVRRYKEAGGHAARIL